MKTLLDTHDAFNLILLLIALLAFNRIVGAKSNTLEFWHIFATRSADGIYYVDNDRIGQIAGLVFGAWVVGEITYRDIIKEWSGVVVFIAWLVYAANMAAFGKWARGFLASRYAHRSEQPSSASAGAANH